MTHKARYWLIGWALWLLATAFIVSVTAQPGSDCVLEDGANVRSGPGLAFGVVGVANTGDCFNVIQVEDNGDELYNLWYEVDPGRWVWAGLISLGDVAPVLTPAPTPTQEVIGGDCVWRNEISYLDGETMVLVSRCVY